MRDLVHSEKKNLQNLYFIRLVDRPILKWARSRMHIERIQLV